VVGFPVAVAAQNQNVVSVVYPPHFRIQREIGYWYDMANFGVLFVFAVFATCFNFGFV
jgi:hypothetical protein